MSINFNDVDDNLMKYFLLVDETVKKSLKDTNIRYSIISILIFYSILLSIKNISKYIQIFDNSIFRLFLILSIIYFSTFDIQISILLVIGFVLSLNHLLDSKTKENFNQMENFHQLENFNNNLDTNNDIE